MVDADLMAFWKRTNKNYMFVVRESFSLNDSSDKQFKSTVTFCQTNSLKLVVISWEDPDDLAGFTEDIRSSTSMGFKLIRFDQIDELYKSILNIDTP